MAEKIIVSKKGTLSFLEFLKSAGYAVAVALGYEIQEILKVALKTNVIDFQSSIEKLAMVAVSTFTILVVGYIRGKPSVKSIYNSNEKAIKVAEKIKKENLPDQ